MISTYYDMNETMQLIGCQPVQPILDNKEFKKDFEIPNDAPLSSKETNLVDGDNATFVTL